MLSDADISAIETRVENWARWANSGESGGHRCASAEGRYIPPRADQERLVRESMPIDTCDAELIESVVTRLPTCNRRFMVNFYVRRQTKRAICRCLGLNQLMFDGFKHLTLRQLCQMIHDRTPVKLIKRGAPIWAGLAK